MGYFKVRGRSFIKLNLGEKRSDVYSAITHVSDGLYHSFKIVRKFSMIELYMDDMKIKLEGGSSKFKDSNKIIFKYFL